MINCGCCYFPFPYQCYSTKNACQPISLFGKLVLAKGLAHFSRENVVSLHESATNHPKKNQKLTSIETVTDGSDFRWIVMIVCYVLQTKLHFC